VPGARGIVGVLAAAAIVLGGGESAGAATLKANYQLQGNLASAVAGAPDLTNLGARNRFAFEEVDGASRQVLRFPKGGGLALDTRGLVDPASLSVAVTFRLAEVTRFRRILDFSGGTSDNGFYDFFGKAVLYGTPDASEAVVFDDSYVQIVVTNAVDSEGARRLIAYVNGSEVAAGTASQGFDLASGVLRFFQDNTSGPAGGEESAGAVACILVYDGVLSPDEVGQVAIDPTLCPAPRRAPGRTKAFATGRPKLMSLGRSPVVDTGLTVSCPIGASPCSVRARVSLAGGQRGPAVLGKGGFSLPGGRDAKVLVRLSSNGAKALREAGSLRVRVAAKIAMRGGRAASAQQTGRIRAPKPPAFRPGFYTGTTSQGLPILIFVGRTKVQSVLFRWRIRCADGKVHTNAIAFRGERVRRGRFSFRRALETGGSIRMAGRIRGARASGTLSRAGASAFGTKCPAKRIGWHARASGVETESRR
jgi:hypothetical protein